MRDCTTREEVRAGKADLKGRKAMWPRPLTETEFVDVLVHVLRTTAQMLRLERSREHLLDALRRLAGEIEQQMSKRIGELEILAWRDPLTGLLNRRAIEELANAEIRHHAGSRPLAIGLIDADHFREINRRYLLPGGDQALIGLARTLESVLRGVDAVGRFGGEEFLVVAPETDLAGAAILGERLRASVEQTAIHYKGQRIEATVSVGFAVASTGTASEYEQLMHAAAAALAEAKTTGRNRCVVRALESAQ
jgi:diguanylate cyclase (GGDEF)-like protein